MGKNYTHLAWLSLPLQEWKEDNNYKDLDEVVTKLWLSTTLLNAL